MVWRNARALLANRLGHKCATWVKQEHLKTRTNRNPTQTARQVALSRLKRADHIGDQLRLGHQGAFALDDQTVAERVKEQHPCHQNGQGQKVEDNDLARQWRPVQRNQSAPGTPLADGGVNASFRRFPVFTKKKITLLHRL